MKEEKSKKFNPQEHKAPIRPAVQVWRGETEPPPRASSKEYLSADDTGVYTGESEHERRMRLNPPFYGGN